MHPEVGSRLTNGTALYSWATPPIAGGNGSRNAAAAAPPAAVGDTGEVTSKLLEAQRPGRPAVPRGAGGARRARFGTRPCHAHAHRAGRGAAPDALLATPRAPRPRRHHCAARGLVAAATRPRCAGAVAAGGPAPRGDGGAPLLESRGSAAPRPPPWRSGPRSTYSSECPARVAEGAGRRLLPPFSRLPRFPSVGDWRSFPASGPLCPGRLDAGPSSDWAAAAPPLLQGPLRAPRGLCWGRSREIRGLKTAPVGGSWARVS